MRRDVILVVAATAIGFMAALLLSKPEHRQRIRKEFEKTKRHIPVIKERIKKRTFH